MLGVRLSPNSRKLDVVIEAVRLGAEDSRLQLARGHERHGQVWSDVVLLTRQDLVDRLRRGARVAIGRMKDIPGDFDLLSMLWLQEADGTEVLVAGKGGGPGDELPAPLF